MSTVLNEGFNRRFKAVTANLFIVVGLFVEPSISISKIKFFLEASISIR